MVNRSQEFWKALEAETPLQVAGVVDAYCARLAARAGFRAIYLSGAGVANASFGLPDLGLTSLSDICEEARRISACTELPMLVDADTGFGNLLCVRRTVRELSLSGAAGIHLEDQIPAKRCGHRPRKTLVTQQLMIDRIKAATDARRDDEFIIMARTDAYAVEGLKPALERAKLYVEAGAQMIFAEALSTIDEYRQFVQYVGVPVLANLTEFGQTPLFTTTELREAGVRLALYPLSAFRTMSKAAETTYIEIRKAGTQSHILDKMQTRSELYEALDYEAYERIIDGEFAATDHSQCVTDQEQEATSAKKPAVQAGLRGISAGSTAICTVGAGGDALRYRGYNIEELAQHATYEEVAYLLLYGELPDRLALNRFVNRLIEYRSLPPSLLAELERMPASTHPMDVLRTGCSHLGAVEPEFDFRQQDATAERLLGAMPSILAYWYRFSTSDERINVVTSDVSIAGHFLSILTGSVPNEKYRRFVDVAMILYAEHEFNASTFAARVIAATLADMYSAVAGAIGALRGCLHGGANEAAMALVESFKSPQEATDGVKRMLERKDKIMGFGHAVYKRQDPRSPILKRWSKQLSVAAPDGYLFKISEAIEMLMTNEKKLFPNADFYCATGFHFVGIPTLLFTPLFAVARTAGWCAHIKEQRADNKLIRPSADYTGPTPRDFVNLNDREAATRKPVSVPTGGGN